MQIVYLSNRPNILIDTIIQMQTFMSFVDEIIIICPKKDVKYYDLYLNFPFKIIPEDNLLPHDLKPIKDHALLNFHLKKEALKSTIVNEEFILSDDDYRPLRPIQIEFFKNQNRYNSYFFYDLAFWSSNKTSYDKSLQNTFKVLTKQGYPSLAYSSHMPQIINKSYYLEACNYFKEQSIKYALCDWSIYFNYSIARYPDQFLTPKPYESLNWPDYPYIWPKFVKNNTYTFENYYPHLYNKNDLFEGLSSKVTLLDYQQILEEKLERISDFKNSNNLPPMTYRSKFFRTLYPLLNQIYKPFSKYIHKPQISRVENFHFQLNQK